MGIKGTKPNESKPSSDKTEKGKVKIGRSQNYVSKTYHRMDPVPVFNTTNSCRPSCTEPLR